MLKFPLCACLLMLFASTARARDPVIVMPQGMVACDTDGWATDRDPNGLNVRAAPTLKASPIATFKYRSDVPNATNVQFHIIGYKDGWLLVEGGTYGDYGDPEPKQPVYAGKGWVSASMVSGQFFGGTNGLYSAPSHDSSYTKFSKTTDDVTVKKVLECRAGWTKVETDEGSGWVGSLCNNQVTTCP